MDKVDSSGEEEFEEVETPEEAAEIVHQTVFEFANIILKLCEEEERVHPNKYKNTGKVLPSTKIKFITGLLKVFTKERLVTHYTNYVLNWRKYIDNRKVKIFLENDAIYPGAPKEDIEFFRDLWRPESKFHLGDTEKESVFEYFDTMVHYCQVWKDMTGFVAQWEKDE